MRKKPYTSGTENNASTKCKLPWELRSHRSVNDGLEINNCHTSTPKEIAGNRKNEGSPILSPILQTSVKSIINLTNMTNDDKPLKTLPSLSRSHSSSVLNNDSRKNSVEAVESALCSIHERHFNVSVATCKSSGINNVVSGKPFPLIEGNSFVDIIPLKPTKGSVVSTEVLSDVLTSVECPTYSSKKSDSSTSESVGTSETDQNKSPIKIQNVKNPAFELISLTSSNNLTHFTSSVLEKSSMKVSNLTTPFRNGPSAIVSDDNMADRSKELPATKTENLSRILFDTWCSENENVCTNTTDVNPLVQNHVLNKSLNSPANARSNDKELQSYRNINHQKINTNAVETLNIKISRIDLSEECVRLAKDTDEKINFIESKDCFSVNSAISNNGNNSTDIEGHGNLSSQSKNNTVKSSKKNYLKELEVQKTSFQESEILNKEIDKVPECTNDVNRKPLQRKSCRRLSHLVVPKSSDQKKLSRSSRFRDVYNCSINESTSIRKTEISCLQEENESELEEILEEEESAIVPDIYTARDVVLQRCCQLSPVAFSEAFSEGYWSTCKKIGEGVYGEVFLSEGKDKSVLKIIPIEGDDLVNGEPQKKFDEILSEIVIAMELSNLRSGSINRTNNFSEMKRCLCIKGKYPQELLELWNDYDKRKGSENDSPSMFREDQLYIVLELAFGGCDLEAYCFLNATQAHAALLQIACALAVAEQSLEFEHRDLHWEIFLFQKQLKNILHIGLKDRISVFLQRECRMSYDGCHIYNDLSRDPALFTAEGDYQFEIYRQMQKSTMNRWDSFKPYTNILWLHYLADKMCTMVNYSKKTTKLHKQGIQALKKLYDDLLQYANATDFILKEVLCTQ